MAGGTERIEERGELASKSWSGEEGGGGGVSVCYDLPLSQTGINPIIGGKCFAYFFILLIYIVYHEYA